MMPRIRDHITAIVSDIRVSDGDLLAAVRDVHLAIEALVLSGALESGGWSLTGAAKALGAPVGTVRKALGRHPEIEAERAIKGPVPLAKRRKNSA
jgi:hypothetical protein